MAKFNKIIGFLALATVLISLWMVIFWVPTESAMGIVQKIMYVHVPLIWVTFLALFVTFLCSVGYLWKRTEGYDVVAYSSAEIGVLFCGLSLLSGAIWGKPTWNTYWTWDARLTTTLILFLIFMGYLLLRKFIDYGEQQARLSAIIAIIGTLDIPIIHQSVSWWRTLHQPSTMFSTQKNVIDTPLMIMLWVSVFSFTLVYIYTLLSRIELEQKTRLYYKTVANLN
jgi:heme exporter protein C